MFEGWEQRNYVCLTFILNKVNSIILKLIVQYCKFFMVSKNLLNLSFKINFTLILYDILHSTNRTVISLL